MLVSDAAAMMSHSLPRPGRPPSPREARHPARQLFGVLSADRGGSGCETPGQPDAQVQGPTTTLFTTCVLNPLLCIEPELHSRRHVRTLWGARD